MPNMDEVVRRFEEIKSYDDSWWLRYLSEKTIFDTDNIKAQKDFLIESLGLLIEERDLIKLSEQIAVDSLKDMNALVAEQDKEIQRYKEIMDRVSDLLRHDSHAYKMLQDAIKS